MDKEDIPNVFSAKLKFYMKKNKITGEALSKKLGVTSGAIYNYKNGNRFPNDILKIYEIADILGVSVIDLLPYSLEEKKKIIKAELQDNIEEYEVYLPKCTIPSSLKKISLINGLVGAGSFGSNESNEIVDSVYVDIHTIDKAYRNKELQAIRVAGDSMTPYVNDNDLVLFHKLNNGESIYGDGKYIISTSQGEQVKNIKFMLNGNIRIISENPSYHTKDGYDEEIDKGSQEYLNIIGKVVGRILKG